LTDARAADVIRAGDTYRLPMTQRSRLSVDALLQEDHQLGR